MNYIELINNYWSLREQGIISPLEGDLYLYLIRTCNRYGWKNPFNQTTSAICAFLGINRTALINRRNKLKQIGLIDFKEGVAQTKPAIYEIKCIKKDTQGSTPIDTPYDTQPDTPSGTTNTINKTKLNKTIKLKFDYRKNLLERIDDEKLVDEFLQVRKLKKLANTETALNDLVSHCEKHNFDLLEAVRWCVKRSWGGFNVKWLENSGELKTSNQHQLPQREETIGGIKKSEVEKFANQ